MEHYKLKEGMNVIDTPNKAGSMHIFVRDGQVRKMTLFNATVSKKTTRYSQQNGEKSSWVNMEIKTDW